MIADEMTCSLIISIPEKLLPVERTGRYAPYSSKSTNVICEIRSFNKSSLTGEKPWTIVIPVNLSRNDN